MSSLSIQGSKGSSSTHTPVESPDSLINTSYANILDAISEGPIVGLVNGAQSIYFDQTPLANADGSLNFTGVTWEQRTGEAEQDYISGFPAVEAETSVGIELKASQPWTQALSNIQLSAVRIRLGASSLYQTDSDGDTGGYTVEYAVDLATDGGDYTTVLSTSFVGKTTSGYQRSHRIELPKATMGWQVRVRRITADSTTSSIVATTTVISYTEVIDAKLQYPYTALVGVKVDASQFSAIPERAYRIRGRTIQVPANYEPTTRAYTGTWDGTFKIAWTDNPAWIYRDLVLNDRYGLGRYISDSQVDKWGLYQIAQYCDVLVSDGKGGTEPRFTCNLYLQSQNDALSVLQDMASIFRGMSYYASSEVVVSADMPADPVYTYTNSNVVNGKFSRAGSSGSTRYSVCKVAWSDRDNFGNVRTEYVQDQKSLARYGIRETSITAFGCVSQGQAQRLGQYTILTNQLETDTISFSVGLDGTVARPGQIVRVADENFAGRPIGGRIKAATTNSVTLDSDVQVAAGDTLVIILPTGTAQTRVVRSVAGRVISVTQAFSGVPVTESIYAIETAQLVPEVYRILTVAENFGDDKLQYDIVAVQHNASKFAAIDSGAKIVYPPTTVLPSAIQAVPSNIILSTYEAVKQGLTVTTMRVTWDQSKGAASYNVWWRRDSGDWIYAGATYTNAIEVTGIYTGTYTARVSAVGVSGNSSLWGYSEPTLLQGKAGLPPAVTSLTATSQFFGIGLAWTFPDGAEDTQRTELWYSKTTSLGDATKLADLAYPQADYTMQSLLAGATFFFWARLVDRTGNLGPWYPQGVGVQGQASSEAGPILDLIAGQIGESELGKELQERIELIDGSGPGSVNERLDEAKEDLAQQISDVNTQVDDAKAELQQQIDAIGDIADSAAYDPDKAYTAGQSVLGGDGILYQASGDVPANTPPPNTTYWTNVGQAVSTANGLAARVQTVETKVTTLEGVTTSQATQINGLQSSLTTTNGNVTAAQNAANAANTLAGGKGKVLVQSTTPAAADQLAQNLWIDTTNNANTPKRWTGAAWAAVTDKAATDAATAAANALALAQTKADATAVNSLTTRVTAAEGTITSQGTAITGLQTTVADKADSSALNSLTSRVTAAEGNVTSQGNRVTSLENSVNSTTTGLGTKASSAAVDALTNRVTATETGLTSASNNITSLANSLGNAGGENLVYNPDFVRESSTLGIAAGWLMDGTSTTATASLVTSWLNPGEKSQRIDATGLSATAYRSVTTAVAQRVKVAAGQTLTASAYVRGSAGLAARVFLQWINASGAAISAPSSQAFTMTGDTVRISLSGAAPAGAVSVGLYFRVYGAGSVTSGYIEVTRAQAEYSDVPTGWKNNGQLLAADALATSTAVSALSSTVSQQGATLNSQSSSITSLSNSLGDAGSVNLLFNPSFDTGSGAVADGWILQGGVSSATGALVASTLAPDGYAQRITSTNISPSLYVEVSPIAGKRPQIAVGTTITLSANLRGTPGARYEMYIYPLSSSGSATGTKGVGGTITDAWQRISVTHTIPANTTAVSVLLRLVGTTSITSGFIEFDQAQLEKGSVATGWRDSAGVLADGAAATSGAVTSLTSTVTQQGSTLTAQAGQISSLQTSVGNANTSIQSESSARADADTALGKRVDTVQTSLGSTNASVQSISTAQTTLAGKVNASYTVKLGVTSNGQYYAAGYGIGMDNSTGVLQSSFVVSADRFAILNGITGGTLTSPFAVAGGQVFINQAFIQDGSISNAKIGNRIQSDNYVSGRSGWAMDKSGGLEICGTIAGGGRVVVNGDGVQVFDANDVLRVKLGNLG